MSATTLESVKVRSITTNEFYALTRDTELFVRESQFNVPVLAKARIADRITPFYNDKVEIQSIYGVSCQYAADEIFIADDDGEEMPLMPTAGRKVTATLFLPGMEDAEIQERIRKALRQEFGPGVVELWKVRTAPARDVRWDVFFERRDVGPGGEWMAVERVLKASGVRDGHHHTFMGTEPAGWRISFQVHGASSDPAEVL